METFLRGNCARTRSQFKSYYVVWKPQNENDENDIGRSLNRTMQYGNELISKQFNSGKTFKSYYVVWKLLCALYLFKKFFGLNRTMQYGNNSLCILPFFHLVGLNRTMQYGNPIGKTTVTRYLNTFKSYYVVWKLTYVGFMVIIHPLFKSYYVVWKQMAEVICGADPTCLNRTMQYGNVTVY